MSKITLLEDEFLGLDTVYVRTPRGTQSARALNAGLPRKVRTLLMAVDGRTTVRMFQRLLPNFGDVEALLEALEERGYISPLRLAQRRAQGGAPSAQARGAASPPDSRPPGSPSSESTQRFADTVLSNWRGFQSTHNDVGFDIDAPLSGHHSVIDEAWRVREARALITDFLFANLPDAALETVLSLERLETTEEIERALKEYQHLVAPCGRKGAEHVAAVRKVLSS